MKNTVNRRRFLQGVMGGGAMLASAGASRPAAAQESPPNQYQGGISPWPLVINTSTIRPTPFLDKIRIAAETGWDGIEVWVNELEEYESGGGDLKALAREIKDRGLYVPNVIGLWDAMPPTPETFEHSLEATRKRMRMAADAGSIYVAAIPTPDREDFDVQWGAHCYRELLRIGREDYNITVAFEFVGFFKGVHRLGQACAVALDANDSHACLIADTFHLFRGDSGFNGIKHLQGSFIANFHWNDVPGNVPREEQKDEHRLYPGDGILPLGQALRDLKAIGYNRALSLELFNRAHWEQDPKVVAETGLRKMKECIAGAGL